MNHGDQVSLKVMVENPETMPIRIPIICLMQYCYSLQIPVLDNRLAWHRVRVYGRILGVKRIQMRQRPVVLILRGFLLAFIAGNLGLVFFWLTILASAYLPLEGVVPLYGVFLGLEAALLYRGVWLIVKGYLRLRHFRKVATQLASSDPQPGSTD
jgi:hypothetical protein